MLKQTTELGRKYRSLNLHPWLFCSEILSDLDVTNELLHLCRRLNINNFFRVSVETPLILRF